MASQAMKLSILIGADAAGAKAGGAEAERAIARVGKAANDASTSVQGLINAELGLGKASAGTEMRAADIEAYGAQLDALRAKYNPLFAVVTRYKTEVAGIRQAHALGAISTKEMTAALTKERQATMSSIDAIKGRNAAIRSMPSAANGNAQGFQTSNIAAQFQDIGVSAAMGMSPLQIALQQGTQLSAVFAGMKNPIVGIGAALASVFSPVSLVTIGVVGLTAAVLQYGSAFISAGRDSEETLQKQRDLIGEVAQQWGDTMPALKAYFDELKKAEDAKQQQAGLAAAIDLTWSDGRQSVQQLNVMMAEAINRLQTVGASAAGIRTVETTFQNLKSRVEAGTASFEDIRNAQVSLALAFNENSMPAVEGITAAFTALSAIIDEASGRTKRFKDVSSDMLAERAQRLKEITPYAEAQLKLQQAYRDQYNPSNIPAGTPIPTPGEKPNLLDFDPDEEANKKLEVERKKSADALEQQRESYTDYLQTQQVGLERLELEISLVGQSAEARAKAIAAFEAEQKIRELGVAITAKEADGLRALAQLQAERRLDLERQVAAYGAVQQAGSTMIDQLTTGTGSLKDRLKGMAETMLSTFQQIAVANPMKNMLLGTNLPTLGDLFSGKTASAPGATSTGTMTVTAASVMINGSPVGLPGASSAVTGLLGTASNTAANTNVAGAAAAASASGTDVQAMVWNHWASKGLQPHQIAGIMGNVGAESAFNPAAVGDGGKALGLAQWNDRGPAMAAAVPDWRTNPQGQLDFMSKEFATTETGSWNKLMASTDVRSATSAVAGYERPRGYSAANPEGADNFSGRLQGADQAMQKFGQTTNSASKNIDTLSTGAIDASKALNSGSNSISNSAGTLASQTAEVPAQSQGLFSSLFSSLGKGLSGLTSGIGSIFSSIFSGLFADGAAFSGGSVVAFASGGIVDRPTMFGMSGGRTGLMGEAGPEAIMPLQRGPGGKLGVAAAMPRQVRQSGGEMKISMSSSNSLHIYGTSDAERDAQWRQGTQLLLDQRDKQWRDNFPDMAEAWRKNPHDRMSS